MWNGRSSTVNLLAPTLGSFAESAIRVSSRNSLWLIGDRWLDRKLGFMFDQYFHASNLLFFFRQPIDHLSPNCKRSPHKSTLLFQWSPLRNAISYVSGLLGETLTSESVSIVYRLIRPLGAPPLIRIMNAFIITFTITFIVRKYWR